jgi:hypothetical protein
MESEAYADGREAYCIGLDAGMNPYEEGTKGYAAWNNGWWDAADSDVLGDDSE